MPAAPAGHLPLKRRSRPLLVLPRGLPGRRRPDRHQPVPPLGRPRRRPGPDQPLPIHMVSGTCGVVEPQSNNLRTIANSGDRYVVVGP